MNINWTLIKLLIRIHREAINLDDQKLHSKTEMTIDEWQNIENSTAEPSLKLISSIMATTDFSTARLFSQAKCFTINIQSSHPHLVESIKANDLFGTDVTEIYWLIKNNQHLLGKDHTGSKVLYQAKPESYYDDMFIPYWLDSDYVDSNVPAFVRKKRYYSGQLNSD